MTLVIDGQPQPRPPALPDFDLRLRDIREPIAVPEVVLEIPMSAWLAEEDFADTLRIDLTELRG